MKWVLLWFVVLSNGHTTSGSAPYATKEACSQAKDALGTLVLNSTIKSNLSGQLHAACTPSGE